MHRWSWAKFCFQVEKQVSTVQYQPEKILIQSSNTCLSPSGISTKKNVAINAGKDLTGSHFWGNSSIPFGGTLPSRGAHGNLPGCFQLLTLLKCLHLILSLTRFRYCLFCVFKGTNTITGGYMPSFYKKEVGSAGHRGHQGPTVESTASSEDLFCRFL